MVVLPHLQFNDEAQFLRLSIGPFMRGIAGHFRLSVVMCLANELKVLDIDVIA